MKPEKFLSVFTPLGIFGSALAGMILMIVGAETGAPALMGVGGGVLVGGIAIVAIITSALKSKSAPLEKRLGLDRYVNGDAADDDDDDGEAQSARYETLLSMRLPNRTVADVFDREDALTALMERSEMNGLIQHYEEEADKLWDNYEGEDSSETVDKLYELIDKYYAMYKQALPYFNKSKDSAAPEADDEVDSSTYDHEVVEQETQQEEKEEINSRANDREVVDKEPEQYVPPVIETPVTPERRPEQPAPPARTGAAVGYKPMKKK